MTVDEALATLERYGKVSIDDPHGEGVYTVLAAADSYYNMPSLYWRGTEGDDVFVHQWNGRYGRLIPWLVNWNSAHYTARDGYGEDLKIDRSAQARIVIGVILSGRRLNRMTCGDTISSLNTRP